MSKGEKTGQAMMAVRFHQFGEPEDVLQMDQIPIPYPNAGTVRIRVHACGLNPADWALCRGLFPGNLPRGIGLELSGFVDAVGSEVRDVDVGDAVFGASDYAGCASAGVADWSIMNAWAKVPDGLSLKEAAAIPMVTETAYRSLESLMVATGQTVMIHGAGTMVGFVAVQLALLKGARVIATAGSTYAHKLAEMGAEVTGYGEGMVKRVTAMASGFVDLVLDTAPPGSGVLPELVEIAGGDPRRVLTITDFAAADALGVRHSFSEGHPLRYDKLAEFAALAEKGKLTIPLAGEFAFEAWREAMRISLSGQARGKLILFRHRAN